MAIGRNPGVGSHLRLLFESGVAAGLSDRELIERFAARSGEASELAFAALVQRHGPRVHSLALSPDGVRLAYAGPGHSIRLWILAGLEPRERAVLAGNGRPISSMAFSFDGKALVASSNAGTRSRSLRGCTRRLK